LLPLAQDWERGLRGEGRLAQDWERGLGGIGVKIR